MASEVKYEKVSDNIFQKIWNYVNIKLDGYKFLFVCSVITLLIGLGVLIFTSNKEYWGQYGDFIGGVLGTIVAFLSVYYLVRTFREQKNANIKVSEDNKMVADIYKLQQFDNRFHYLMKLYHNSIKKYSYNSFTGDEALKEIVNELHNISIDYKKIYKSRLLDSRTLFDNKFYIPNRLCAAVQFRLLYQIFNIIESDLWAKSDKIAYAKSIRGQINEDELLLLRYNCWSPYGLKMQIHVNHYNLLKHLPPLNLLEFHFWRHNIFTTDEYRNAIDTSLIYQRKWIIENFSFQLTDSLNSEYKLTERYRVRIEWSKDKKNFSYILSKNNGLESKETLDFALDKLNEEHITDFITDFLRELFCYSNFCLFNDENDIKFEKKPIDYDEDRQLKTFQVDVVSLTEMVLHYENYISRSPDMHPEKESVERM